MESAESSKSSPDLMLLADRLEQGLIDIEKARVNIKEAVSELKEALASRIGETIEMEGLAERYLPQAAAPEDKVFMSRGFEDLSERPLRVTTGFRPLKIVHVGELGVTVEIEGELKRPILLPETIRFVPSPEAG